MRFLIAFVIGTVASSAATNKRSFQFPSNWHKQEEHYSLRQAIKFTKQEGSRDLLQQAAEEMRANKPISDPILRGVLESNILATGGGGDMLCYLRSEYFKNPVRAVPFGSIHNGPADVANKCVILYTLFVRLTQTYPEGSLFPDMEDEMNKYKALADGFFSEAQIATIRHHIDSDNIKEFLHAISLMIREFKSATYSTLKYDLLAMFVPPEVARDLKTRLDTAGREIGTFNRRIDEDIDHLMGKLKESRDRIEARIVSQNSGWLNVFAQGCSYSFFFNNLTPLLKHKPDEYFFAPGTFQCGAERGDQKVFNSRFYFNPESSQFTLRCWTGSAGTEGYREFNELSGARNLFIRSILRPISPEDHKLAAEGDAETQYYAEPASRVCSHLATDKRAYFQKLVLGLDNKESVGYKLRQLESAKMKRAEWISSFFDSKL
jgi:hypothetical protein